MIKVFILSPESTKASENARRAGDNAIFVVIKMLREFGLDVIGNEVSQLPEGKPVSLQRRSAAIQLHKQANVTVIMGNDTLRNVRSWFPVNEAINAPKPFFYINEPGRIKIELVEKIKDAFIPDRLVFGFDEDNKTFGV